jgi:hypothetical protein
MIYLSTNDNGILLLHKILFISPKIFNPPINYLHYKASFTCALHWLPSAAAGGWLL